jgi:hypothetical protein
MDRRRFLGVGAVIISTGLTGCFGGGGGTTVRIDYSGSWQGSIGSSGSQRSIQGSGSESYDVDADIISAVVQKRDNGRGTLTVEIREGGEVERAQSTSAQYGTVSVSYRP